MRRRALRVVVVACVAAVTYGMLAAFGGFEYAAVGSPSSAQYGKDTAVVGAEQEPPCLNVLLTTCFGSWTTAGVALAGAYRVAPDFSFEPVLVDRVDVVTPTRNRPFSLTYHIEPGAVWSDGTPVSADDFIFTLDVTLDPDNAILDRSGYDRIADAVEVDQKTVRFVFGQPYAAWKTLFPAVLPKHVLEGRDFDQVWLTEIADPATGDPIGSGPFLVTDRVPGWLTLSRNPLWWGGRAPDLDAIVFHFIPNVDAEIQAITDGEVDAIYPNIQPQLAQLRALPDLAIESNPGAILEHVDFNTASADMPLLREQWFRQAFAFALDRTALATTLFDATSPGTAPLQSLLYLSQQKEYEPHFAQYAYSPQTVANIMRRHNCALGGDGIWSCGGTRASITFATTTGNPRRALAQQELQAQARNAGIELVFDNSPALVLFQTRLPAGDFQLTMFAWISETSDPAALWVREYGCGGPSNFTRYCSQEVTDLLTQSDDELDPRKRSSLVNRADRILADDVPSIPLYQRPTFLAHWKTLRGLQGNPSFEGLTWNVEDWRKS